MPPNRPGATVAIAGTEPVVLSFPEIRLVAVTPAARRHGAREALIHKWSNRARDLGARSLILHTTDLMQPAIKLYSHMGLERAPDLGTQPFPEMTTKGFRLNFENDGM